MTNHVKPTKEELLANINRFIQDTEQSEVQTQSENSVKDTATTEVEAQKQPEVEVKQEQTEEKQVEAPKQEEVAQEKAEEKPSEEQIDYKKKFIDSSREALILHSKNKKIFEAVENASALPEPTDEQMLQEYPEWDVMNITEKRFAKENYLNRMRFKMLEDVTKESKNIEEWNSKVDSYIEDPKTLVNNPELENKLEDFKIFASRESRRGANLEDITKAFLWDYAQNKPKHKGQMFETGTGGPNEKPVKVSDKVSMEQADEIRKTNYAEYKRLLLAGKIDTSVL